jgi:hypothetical protein
MDNTQKAHQFKQIRGLMSGIPVKRVFVNSGLMTSGKR